jgi:hypothetical protein
MTMEELEEYNREKYLFLQEQGLAWKEKRLH